MAEIVWPSADDMESTVAVMKDKVAEHHKALYGNGKEGLLDWVAGIKGQFRLLMTITILFGSLSSIGLLILGILEFNRQTQQHLLHFPKVFSSAGGTDFCTFRPGTAESAQLPNMR